MQKIERVYLGHQLILLFNQLLIIAYFGYESVGGHALQASDLFLLGFSTLIVMDAIYIGAMNLKNSRMLARFSGLLLLVAWFFLWSADGQGMAQTLLSFAGPVVFYSTVRFGLAFLFQDSAYKLQRQTDAILKISLALALLARGFGESWSALMYLAQLLLGTVICLYLLWMHRSRVLFVLKNERKPLVASVSLGVVLFTGYVLQFGHDSAYLSNSGAFLLLFLPLFSIHGIAFRSRKEMPALHLLGSAASGIFLAALVAMLSTAGWALRWNIAEVFLVIHCALALLLLYGILLFAGVNRRGVMNAEAATLAAEGFYVRSLRQLKREEQLRRDFANYLHDEVLQDLLAVKNLLHKSDNPEVRRIIAETLDDLNISIRHRMQEYHPPLLGRLTLRENVQKMLDRIRQTHPMKAWTIEFDCDDKLFLVEPYNLIVYRFIKELATNAFKHSQGSRLKVALAQEREDVKLIVEDDGIGLLLPAPEHVEKKGRQGRDGEDLPPFSGDGRHKGLASIREQAALIGGTLKLERTLPSGLRVTIGFAMKGEDSYAHFIDR